MSVMITSYYRLFRNLRNREFIVYLIIAVLFAWCLWATFVQQYHYLKPSAPLAFDRFLAQIISLAILVLVFFGLTMNRVGRMTLSLLASLVVLGAGSYLNFYDTLSAIQSININALSLLVGLAVVSAVFEESNVFAVIASRVVEKYGTGNFAIFVVLCLMSFLVSLVISSSTAILIMLSLTFNIVRSLRLNPVPYVVGEIIASNLGGTATMMGGFPNMVIATQMKIPLQSFIRYLMPVCLFNLGVVFFYFGRRINFGTGRDPELRLKLPNVAIRNFKAVKWSLSVLIAMVALFITSPLPDGIVALCGGMVLITWSGIPRRRLVEKVRLGDVAFFALMFIVMGGVTASGLVQSVKEIVVAVSAKSSFLQCILLMWGACAVTMFINAGPATMLVLPAFLGIQGVGALPGQLIFWALALGVCAGSSAMLTGATAGPVASSAVDIFNKIEKQNISEARLTFNNYMAYGIPIAFVHLIVSTIYITLLYLLGG